MTPELREHYFRHRSERLPSECCDEHRNEYVHCRLANRVGWRRGVGDEECCKDRRAHNKRTPGLFKVEWSGDGFVWLCSKTYYGFEPTDKYSTKGLSKRHNDIDKDAFLEVFTNRWRGSGKNGGFRVRQSTVLTYVQERVALTYFYARRVVHEDGVSMLDSSTRNLIVIDDLMAETDERVTTLFTKKVITGTRPCCIWYITCSLKTKRVIPSV